ncbi:GntR family transcriptional regulator [Alicyclobacillus acidocaldarius]|uniref:Transcriptional regulator, GntR family n=1 Tax=Alicyclobacillus acidocaldarius subsp. acidocaldarius (strain ATCC 27009 / DSM 446 / BCRC 14685 / JCM 5260 / KCTC 1825 / NBRC 15652 / NCIMB 11725 / NRRL B-14509 / 104-IA) TaxID=521098 RepID=C8WW09_ALIAD|nr:GntR family transcriptional regulator [Alicyclobacillus acidocaldarius]ACV58281.1 transcriptional regulator, GntR family [Alicyclobacillus acidocaldarius subsp. acidocaldarius DSM 446]
MRRNAGGERRLGDVIADVLRREIVWGEWPSGHVFSENALARRFGTSRSPVREALRQLAHEGLISLGRNGARVVGLDLGDALELYDVRSLIEQFTASRVCERPRAERESLAHTLSTLVLAMEEAASRRDWQSFSDLDLAYHDAIVRAANHRRVLRMWDEMRSLVQLTLALVMRKRMQRGDADMRGALAQHRSLAEAILAGDAAWVRRVMQSHVEETRRLLEGGLRGHPAGDER